MVFLSDLEIADKLNHPFFNGEGLSDIAKKKRVRQLARQAHISPVVKKHDIWLFLEEDIELLKQCRSSLQNEKTRPGGKLRGRIAESAFEKARRLTSAT